MFAGGILKAFDLVQIMMIELFVKRLKGPREIGEIHDPAGLLRHRSGNADFNPEGMSMQPAAFVVFRNVRQMMRRLDGEDFEYLHGNNRQYDRASLTAFVRRGNHEGARRLAYPALE